MSSGYIMHDPSTMPIDGTDGSISSPITDLKGRVIVYVGTKAGGEDVTNDIQGIVNKPITADTYNLSWDDSANQEASSVIKASAGNLFYVLVYNANVAVRFFQIFNSATVPADGAVPVISIPINANSSLHLPVPPQGRSFTNGMAWSNSTTQAIKTIGGADMWANIGYL